MGSSSKFARRVLAAAACTAVAATALWSPAPSAAQATDNVWLTERRFLNLAHGGGLHEAPQGTLFAYKTAIERGANALEMDLHITLDGHVVAIHDSTVDRTTNGTGCVVSKTLAELKALDAAHTFVPGRGPASSAPVEDYTMRGIATGDMAPPSGFVANDFTIATLEEIFQAQPDALMLMELKPTEIYQSHDCPAFVASLDPADRPDLAAEVARLIDVYDMADQVMVASFIDELLQHFMTLAPDVDTSFPVNESIAVYVAFLTGDPLPNPNGHEAFQLPLNFSGIEITEDLVHYAQAHDIAVHFWPINDVQTMQMLIDWGADGIITDRPQVLAALLDELFPPDTTPPDTGPPATAPPNTWPTTTSGSTSSSTTSAPTDSTGPGAGVSTTIPGGPSDPGPDPETPGGVGSGQDRAANPAALVRTGLDVTPLGIGLTLTALGGLVLALRQLTYRATANRERQTS